MTDYRPVSLARFCNAGSEVLEHGKSFPVGKQLWHGLPFLVGATGKRGKQVVAFGAGLRGESLVIPIRRNARYLIFAHRLLESKVLEGDPIGRVCADYVVRFDDGSGTITPIRERLEIGVIPYNWGQWPMLAYPEESDVLFPRYVGDWGSAGNRLTEAYQGSAQTFYLWAWENPEPGRRIAALTIVPKGQRFVLGAITLGHANEYPFYRMAKSAVRIVLPRAGDARKKFNLEVRVDRGVATYPYPLPLENAKHFLADSAKGWGQEENPHASPSYVEIAATPSATITVKQDGKKLGSTKWGALQKKRRVRASPRLELAVVDPGRNWVKTTVLDAQTGKPVPCRIHFRSATGIPYQPHGHHNYINSNLGTWHHDVGGDLRLGQATYAYIDGKCEGWLPRGEVIVDIARGYEYRPIRARLEIKAGQQELTFRLERLCDMARERYFSGDTHVHFLSTQGAHVEAAGEGLNIVNLLLSQWGHLFTNTEEFTGSPNVSPKNNTIVYASQENRQHILGHLSLLGLKKPVYPWCSDGLSEAEMGGNMETTLAHWADSCHEQGGTVVLPHGPNPNCEAAALLATGRLDAFEFAVQGSYEHLEYYRYLNCGYRLPLVGGTDKMGSDVPVGIYRTYVHIPDSEPFTYDNWCKRLRAGNTFQTGGPLLRFTVDGKPIGSTINLPGNGGKVDVEVAAESILPFETLELVMNGAVIASTENLKGMLRARLHERVRVERHSWLAARCGGPGYFYGRRHHDGWKRPVMAHTSPIYLAVGGEWWMFDAGTASYMLTLMHGGIDYIRTRARQFPEKSVTHHHGKDDHLKFLEEPFRQAIATIHERMHKLGVSH